MFHLHNFSKSSWRRSCAFVCLCINPFSLSFILNLASSFSIFSRFKNPLRIKECTEHCTEKGLFRNGEKNATVKIFGQAKKLSVAFFN